MITHARILVTDETNPHNNLALEDALLHTLPEGQALLFLWQNKHTVVVGAGQNAWRECHTQRLREEKGTLARRGSGGGAVYHDLGNLNFSFLLPRADYDVPRQLGVVLEAVRSLGIGAEMSGRNDLLADGRKFSGNAFRLLKETALHHGTIMINVDKQYLGRYLNVDQKKLESKGVKSVPSRVVNLRELANVGVDDVRSAMIRAFRAAYGEAPAENAAGVRPSGLDALEARYQSWEWNYGASPSGSVNLMERFDWGLLELSFHLVNGRLKDVQVFTDAMDETLHERLARALEGAHWHGEELRARVQALGLEDVARFLRDAES